MKSHVARSTKKGAAAKEGKAGGWPVRRPVETEGSLGWGSVSRGLMARSRFGDGLAVQRQGAGVPESEPLAEEGMGAFQRKAFGVVQRADAKPEPNRTGLPDKLKAGVEAMSGFDLSGVRVNYNSPKPAQVQAHAYTQGQTIEVARGQEKHVPHEAWHVVQQMQGRVRPTVEVNGVGVNDDRGLEQEADVMGREIQKKKEEGDRLASKGGESIKEIQRKQYKSSDQPAKHKVDHTLIKVGKTKVPKRCLVTNLAIVNRAVGQSSSKGCSLVGQQLGGTKTQKFGNYFADCHMFSEAFGGKADDYNLFLAPTDTNVQMTWMEETLKELLASGEVLDYDITLNYGRQVDTSVYKWALGLIPSSVDMRFVEKERTEDGRWVVEDGKKWKHMNITVPDPQTLVNANDNSNKMYVSTQGQGAKVDISPEEDAESESKKMSIFLTYTGEDFEKWYGVVRQEGTSYEAFKETAWWKRLKSSTSIPEEKKVNMENHVNSAVVDSRWRREAMEVDRGEEPVPVDMMMEEADDMRQVAPPLDGLESAITAELERLWSANQNAIEKWYDTHIAPWNLDESSDPWARLMQWARIKLRSEVARGFMVVQEIQERIKEQLESQEAINLG